MIDKRNVRFVTMKTSAVLLALCLALAGAMSNAQSLNIGDPAPKYAPAEVLQGEPVVTFQEGNLYILDFWATWCIPCLESMPHLEQLHNDFQGKNVVVIAQNVGEKRDEVVAFLNEHPQGTMRVAVDTEAGGVYAAWLKTAGADGIPTTFVVGKQGTVLWIGHPQELTPELLSAMLDGSFDVAAARKAHAAAREEQQRYAEAEKRYESLEKKYQRALRRKSWAAAHELADKMAEVFADTNNLHWYLPHFGGSVDCPAQALHLKAFLKEKNTGQAIQTLENMSSYCRGNMDVPELQDYIMADGLLLVQYTAKVINDLDVSGEKYRERLAGVRATIDRLLIWDSSRHEGGERERAIIEIWSPGFLDSYLTVLRETGSVKGGIALLERRRAIINKRLERQADPIVKTMLVQTEKDLDRAIHRLHEPGDSPNGQ